MGKVLVVGSGAREHALAWKLAKSVGEKNVIIAPGNAGWALTEAVAVNDAAGIVALARQARVDLVVVGPEAALEAGVVDALQAAGVPAFGPTRAAARIETSKVFAKRLMERCGVPTARFRVAESLETAEREIRAHFTRTVTEPLVVKADRLMAGKGVAVCATEAEALAFAREVGGVLVLEECVRGNEVSLHVVTDGERCVALPIARDHKRLLDGDRGPNTGGMGAIAPAQTGRVDAVTLVERCVRPMLAEMAAAGTPFRGVVFAGLMIDGDSVNVLEYNARFGDPETEALMVLLGGDLLSLLAEPARAGTPSAIGAAAAVVLAARGYPVAPEKGSVIAGIESVDDAVIFHAGTRRDGTRIVVHGGRVLVVVARGENIGEALDSAYRNVDRLHFDGMQARRDIGATARS